MKPVGDKVEKGNFCVERDGYDNPDVKIFFTEEVKKESSPLPLLHPFILSLPPLSFSRFYFFIFLGLSLLLFVSFSSLSHHQGRRS